MTRPPEVIAASGEVKDERVAFEDWFRGANHDRLCRNMPDKSYNDPTAHSMWQAWRARAAQDKTSFDHWVGEVEASGEAEKHAVCATCNGNGLIGGPSYYNPGEGGVPCPDCDELALIDTAISHLQHARSALNREQPETATGRGYVQDARAALAKVQS